MSSESLSTTKRHPEITDLQGLLDDRSVRDLTAHFSDACNTGDVAKFRQLWKPDGVWTIDKPRAGQGEGVDAIADMLTGLLDAWAFFFQMTHSGVVKVKGDRARARWNVQEIARMPKSAGFYNNLGIYEDELERIDGVWLFTKRRYEYIYLDDSPVLNGNSFAVATALQM